MKMKVYQALLLLAITTSFASSFTFKAGSSRDSRSLLARVKSQPVVMAKSFLGSEVILAKQKKKEEELRAELFAIDKQITKINQDIRRGQFLSSTQVSLIGDLESKINELKNENLLLQNEITELEEQVNSGQITQQEGDEKKKPNADQISLNQRQINKFRGKITDRVASLKEIQDKIKEALIVRRELSKEFEEIRLNLIALEEEEAKE